MNILQKSLATTPLQPVKYRKDNLKPELILTFITATTVLFNIHYGIFVITEKLAQISNITPVA